MDDKPNTLKDVHVPFKHDSAPDAAAGASVRKVAVKEAKAKLTELLRQVEAGETIVLTRHGKPVADLVPHVETKPMSVMERYEAWRKENPPLGIGWVSPDFDDPLAEDFLLQPLPDDFDAKLVEHDRRIDEARAKRDARKNRDAGGE